MVTDEIPNVKPVLYWFRTKMTDFESNSNELTIYLCTYALGNNKNLQRKPFCLCAFEVAHEQLLQQPVGTSLCPRRRAIHFDTRSEAASVYHGAGGQMSALPSKEILRGTDKVYGPNIVCSVHAKDHKNNREGLIDKWNCWSGWWGCRDTFRRDIHKLCIGEWNPHVCVKPKCARKKRNNSVKQCII